MRFICTHTLPPHAVTPDQLEGMAKAAQNDPVIRGYRSFMNLSEGHAVCIMEGPDAQSVVNWFKKMNMPYDSVVALEYEGDCGKIREEPGVHAHA